jgi:hypothetical protein
MLGVILFSRLAEAVGSQLREQAKSQAGQGTSPDDPVVMDTPTGASPEPEAQLSSVDGQAVKHRPYREKVDSQDKVAAEIGMSQSQVSDAQRHVEAVERCP